MTYLEYGELFLKQKKMDGQSLLTNRNSSLWNKIHDESYLESLSGRRRKELEFCKKILSEDELKSYSSIDVAYYKARERFLEEYVKEYDPKLYRRGKMSYPIFGKKEILDKVRNDNKHV